MEALLRWQHPDLGLVAPMQFIPVAEETGLIVPIGKWVLKTACLQNVAWQKQGLPRLNIAVNLTARQFHDEHLLSDIASILKATAMDAHLLEIELHESLLIHDVENTLRKLTELKGMGVRIAIDDFGAGYSSLASLQRFPLDTIKIDRSFIRDVATLPADGSLAKPYRHGKDSELDGRRPGVETEAQAEFLREHACTTELQGFYFNKPVSTQQFTEVATGADREHHVRRLAGGSAKVTVTRAARILDLAEGRHRSFQNTKSTAALNRLRVPPG
jgi:EAL domain-containing protein (putative c-di-GMP-specific phosphodiesterase class I)